jgi:hypothetical protein
MPWLARHSMKAWVDSSDCRVVQAAGAVVVASPAALTVPADRIQAPGWPGRFSVPRWNWLECGPPPPCSVIVRSEVTETTACSAGSRFGR